MNSVVRALQEGLSVLGENWALVFVILLLVLLGQFVVYHVIKAIFGHRLAGDEYLSLGMAGWLLPVCLISVLWYLLRIATFARLDGGILLVLLGIPTVVLFIRVSVHIPE